MSMRTTNDPIADMLTRIRNSNMRRHRSVIIPYSKIKTDISKILLEEGFISDFKIIGKIPEKQLILELRYRSTEKAIHGLKRISKPGLRIYAESKSLPVVLDGLGIAIVSTSKGLMTSENAMKENIGGEVLAYIW